MTQEKETKTEIIMTIEERLSRLQKMLKVPKEKNDKVSYKSRSAEQILEEAKDHLNDGEFIICEDDIVHIGDRYYVKSISKFCFGKEIITATAFAREQEEILNSYNKPMMQQPQVTGASSSYARKYSLQGLFALDDSSGDPDKQANPKDEKKPEPKQAEKPKPPEPSAEEKAARDEVIERCKPIADALKSAKDEKQLDTILKLQKDVIDKLPEDLKKRILDIAEQKRIGFSQLNAG